MQLDIQGAEDRGGLCFSETGWIGLCIRQKLEADQEDRWEPWGGH